MSKGYPDFFGYSMFPSYGQIETQSTASGFLFAGAEADFLDIAVKGISMGGFLSINGFSDPSNLTITMTLDEKILYQSTLQNMIDFNYGEIRTRVISLLYSNGSDNNYVISFLDGLPFQSNYKMHIKNDSASSMFSGGVFYYTIIKN